MTAWRTRPPRTRRSLEFFSPNNWELLVKVLDGRVSNDRFWVFQAAATNVELTTTVTDTSCGATRSYTNPLGVAAPALTDTDAFVDCGTPLPPSCVQDADTICLGDGGRFQLEVGWVDFVGATGVGTQVEIPQAGPTVGADSTLKVTDALTGADKTYTNPLGVSAAALNDTAAFATCDAN